MNCWLSGPGTSVSALVNMLLLSAEIFLRLVLDYIILAEYEWQVAQCSTTYRQKIRRILFFL